MSFKKARDLILGIITLLLSIGYLIMTQFITLRPKLVPAYGNSRFVPVGLGVLLAILSVLLIVQSLYKMKKGHETAESEKVDTTAILLTFVVILSYVLLMPLLGFCLSTMLYLVFQMMVLAPSDKRNILLFIIVSVVFTMLVFVAFRVGLQQLLPRGIIEALLGF